MEKSNNEQRFSATDIGKVLGINKCTVATRARMLGIKPKQGAGGTGPQYSLEEAVFIRDSKTILEARRTAESRERVSRLKVLLDAIPPIDMEHATTKRISILVQS